MISLVVTADSKNIDPAERDLAFAKMLEEFKEPYEIIYVANADFAQLDTLREIAKNSKSRQLIVTAPSTNINTQIYNALDYTNNGDVLLATLDTNLELLTEMLKKHIDGTDIVFAKQQDNWFKSFFIALGRGTYQMGLKLLGRGRDLCCEPRVILLNNRSVNTIILNPTLSKALRLVNPDPERTARIVTKKQIFDTPSASQKETSNSLLALGIVSCFYIIALLVLAVVFPICNNGVYSVWIFVALIAWIILGIIGAVISARFVYNSRLGIPVAINLAGEPVIRISEHILNGEVIEKDENAQPQNEVAVESETATQAQDTTEEKEISSTPQAEAIEEAPKPKRGRPKKVTTENANENTSSAQAKEKKETKAKSTTKKTTKSTTKTGAKKPAVSKVKSTKGVKTKK